jgi:hypothetical protein
MPDSPDPAPAPAPPTLDTRLEAIIALIRNGLSNGPIAQSFATWRHLETQLGEIARAILKEI